MKKAVIAAMTAAMVLGSSFAAMAEERDHLARIQAAGKLNIGLEGDWQPFSFHDEDDKLVGFDVEVAQAIADKLGVEAVFTEAAWDGLFAGMESGRYDMVVNGVDVTPERSETFDFTVPYAYDHTVLIVPAENEDITAFEDLEGLTTANSIGSTYQEIGEQYGAEVKGVDTLVETLQMVVFGQVDATINASTSFGDYMKANPEAPLKVAATSEEATMYAIPLVKGEDNATLLEAVNTAIAELREDGTLAEISERYFSADLTSDASAEAEAATEGMTE